MKELEQLYRKTRCKYIKILRRLLKNQDDAEDVFHNAVVRAVTYYPTYNSEISKLSNWFSRIVFNEYSRWLRKNKQQFIDIDTCNIAVDINMDGYMSMLSTTQNLDGKCREVGELVYIKGYTTNDVSKLVDLSTNEVRYLLDKFKSVLKDSIGAGL